MKKIIFITLLLLVSKISATTAWKPRESRLMTTAPGSVVNNESEQNAPNFKDLQAEIVKLRAEIKKQNELVNQLKATCITLKKENKIMRQSLLDANLPLPNLLEQFEQEQQKLEEEKQKKAAVEKSEELIKPGFSPFLSVGQIARLGPQQMMRIAQIIDVNNMIVTLSLESARSHRLSDEEKTKTVWVKGINTTNMADEQMIKVGNQAFKITGTKTYDTAIGGTKTIFVLEPYAGN